MKFFLLVTFVLCISLAHLAKVPASSTDEALYENGNSGGRNIRDFVAMVQQLGPSGLIDRFSSFRSLNPDKTYWASLQPENIALNRYAFLVLYDYNRVKLDHEFNPEATTDFVSANFVDGFKHKREYIATSCEESKICKDMN